MVHSKIGKIVAESGSEIILVERGEAGNVLYGPYIDLSKGSYAVTFQIASEGGAPREAYCATVDVVTDLGQICIRKLSLSVADIELAGGIVELSFTAHQDATVEFRVFSTGLCRLRVAVDRPVRALSAVDLLPFQLPLHHPSRLLYEEHTPIFQSLERRGAAITKGSSDGLFVEFEGLKLHVLNSEDIQVLGELYIQRCYNIQTRRDKLIVDIGMNAGFTALFFANMPSVREIQAFEPFGVPFDRARRNFDLNPTRAKKIKANHFGLSRTSEEREVLASPDETVGTSVRGMTNGRPERIRLRAADNVIATLARRATAEGLDLIVKMDCEGSEFDIIESLEQANLLASINILIVEWHKWWSPQKSEADLIRPLLTAGFAVHDRTSPDDRYAGMFYAVRTA